MFLQVQTSNLKRQIARNSSQIGKKLQEGESGKQDEPKSEQKRRKSLPRAADKRPKSTDKRLSDAWQQPQSVPDVVQERLREAKWKQQGVRETSGRR